MRGKWSVSLPLAAGVLCAATCVLAAEKEAVFKSSLQPGDRLPASFKCHSVTGPNVTGPNKGKPLCYV